MNTLSDPDSSLHKTYGITIQQKQYEPRQPLSEALHDWLCGRISGYLKQLPQRRYMSLLTTFPTQSVSIGLISWAYACEEKSDGKSYTRFIGQIEVEAGGIVVETLGLELNVEVQLCWAP